MRVFREPGLADYFAGSFSGGSEMLSLVHGHVGLPMIQAFQEPLRRVVRDLARQHLAGRA